MESLVKATGAQRIPITPAFWQGKKVLLTGHTGFKGAWLSLWLQSLGAEVTGFALAAAPMSLYQQANVETALSSSIEGDLRDPQQIEDCVLASQPEIVIHMAAQSLVQYSYQHPLETYQTNVMGTLYLLDALRRCSSVKAILNVTTDKCYENLGERKPFRESDPLGGYDPYSNSKACSELVTSSYRQSFFAPGSFAEHGVAIASARAGNVIGGGDWAQDRVIPDMMRAFLAQQEIVLRHPEAVRPWQFVLEPLYGYLLLIENLFQAGPDYDGAWNFGPEESALKDVRWMVEYMQQRWPGSKPWAAAEKNYPHEAGYLSLDCTKAKESLGWKPVLSLESTLSWILAWYQAYENNQDMKTFTFQQIKNYQELLLQ